MRAVAGLQRPPPLHSAERCYRQRMAHPPQIEALERLLTAAQVAELLGVTSATVYSWAAAGELPAVRLGRRAVRFRPHELEVWLHDQHQPAVHRDGTGPP